MMTIARIAVAGIALLSLTAMPIEAQSPPLVWVGAGGQSCGEWLAVFDKGDKRTDVDTLKLAMLTSWVQGFVIGSATQLTTLLAGSPDLDLATLQARYKTVSGWVFDPPDGNAIEYWITKFCRDNPLEHVNDASEALVAELFTKK